MSLGDLEKLCVQSNMFRTSNTRSTIMQGLRHVVDTLSNEAIPGEVWVDGSFLTKKIDPADVDILLSVRDGFG